MSSVRSLLIVDMSLSLHTNCGLQICNCKCFVHISVNLQQKIVNPKPPVESKLIHLTVFVTFEHRVILLFLETL